MQKNVFIESAFVNQGKNGNDFLKLTLKQSAFNEKGANADVVRTYGADGKEYSGVNLRLRPNKDGISQAETFAKAAGLETEMKDVLDPESRKKILEERNGYVDSLKHKGFNLEMYNSKNDPLPNSIYTRDKNGNLVSPQIKENGKYVTNPEARFAVLGKIEETITPDPDFSYDKHKEALKEINQIRRNAKEVAEKTTPQNTQPNNSFEAPTLNDKDAPPEKDADIPLPF